MAIRSLSALLRLHEGERLKPYIDTVGKTTIGIGRNLTDVGISREESRMLFQHDLERAEAFIDQTWPWAAKWVINRVRRAVLIDMAFNLGGRLKRFKRMLRALEQENYSEAAVQMLDSRWATQVGRRATRLAKMMRTGKWPT